MLCVGNVNDENCPYQRQQQLATGITPLRATWLSRWASSAPVCSSGCAAAVRVGSRRGFSVGSVFTTEFTQQHMSGGGNHAASPHAHHNDDVGGKSGRVAVHGAIQDDEARELAWCY